jgi:hypothetical protein
MNADKDGYDKVFTNCVEAIMPYVLRGSDGKIQAVSDSAAPVKGWEHIDNDSKEYVDYLNSALEKGDPFRESDIQLARVLEDLISMLIDRDFIRFTDFPEPAQKRLIYRQGLRTRNSNLNLIGDDDTI